MKFSKVMTIFAFTSVAIVGAGATYKTYLVSRINKSAPFVLTLLLKQRGIEAKFEKCRLSVWSKHCVLSNVEIKNMSSKFQTDHFITVGDITVLATRIEDTLVLDVTLTDVDVNVEFVDGELNFDEVVEALRGPPPIDDVKMKPTYRAFVVREVTFQDLRITQTMHAEGVTAPPLQYRIPSLVVPIDPRRGDASSIATALTTVLAALSRGLALSSANAVLDVGKFGFRLAGLDTVIAAAESIDRKSRGRAIKQKFPPE